MSRKPTNQPAYCHHRASGRAYVKVRGRTIYLGAHGSPESLKEYERVLTELASHAAREKSEAEAREQAERIAERVAERGASPAPPDLTLAELVEMFFTRHANAHYRKNGEPTNEIVNFRIALRFALNRFGTCLAKEFGPLALKMVREDMVAHGMVRKSINRNVGRIVRVVKWAVSEELLPPSNHHALATVRGIGKGRTAAKEAPPIKPVAVEVVEAALVHASPSIVAMARLQLLTGMRPGEVCIMRPCDIDRSREVWVYVPESHKTEHHGRERKVYIGPKGQAVLIPWLERDPSAYCFQPREEKERRAVVLRKARKTRVQPSQKNRRKANPKRAPRDQWDTCSYGRAIDHACRKAGVAKWNPNQLRHTHATNVRATHGVEAAQLLLGHSSCDVTQVYAETNEAKAVEYAAKLG